MTSRSAEHSNITLHVFLPFKDRELPMLFLASGLLRSPRWRRRVFWCGIILFFIFSNEFIANELMKAWEVDTKAYRDMKKVQARHCADGHCDSTT